MKTNVEQPQEPLLESTASSSADSSQSTVGSNVETQSVRMELRDLKWQLHRVQEDQQLQHKSLLEVLASKFNHHSMISMVENAVDLAVQAQISELMKDPCAAMPIGIAERLERQGQTLELLRSKLDSMIPDKDMLHYAKRQADDLEALRVELGKRLSDVEITEGMATQSLLVESFRACIETRMSNLELCVREMTEGMTSARSTMAAESKKAQDVTTPRSSLARQCKKGALQGPSRAPPGGTGGGSCRVRLDARSNAAPSARSGTQSPSPMPHARKHLASSTASVANSAMSINTFENVCNKLLQGASKRNGCDQLVDNTSETPDSNRADIGTASIDLNSMARHPCKSPMTSSPTESNAASREYYRSSTAAQRQRAGGSLCGKGGPRRDASPPVVRLSSAGYRNAVAASPPRTAIGSPRMSTR